MFINSLTDNIKIILLNILVFSPLQAIELDDTSKIPTFMLNPNAKEFFPSTPLYANNDNNSSEFLQKQSEQIDTIPIYYNYTVAPGYYPEDFKATKNITKKLKKFLPILIQQNPSAIAYAYIALGHAHKEHLYCMQEYYYNLALSIGIQINDIDIMEKSYIALGNMLDESQSIERLVWYYEAFRIKKTKYIKKLAQKNKVNIKKALKNKNIVNTIDAYQRQVLKTFFPFLQIDCFGCRK